MLLKSNQSKHMANIQKQRKKQNKAHSRLVLAQAEESRLGELPSPKQELEKWNWCCHALSLRQDLLA